MQKDFPNSEIFINEEKFLLKEKGLELRKTKNELNKILKVLSDSSDIKLNDINFKYFEKDFFLAKKYIFNIDLDLIDLGNIRNLDIVLKIINPSKAEVLNKNTNIVISKTNILWKLYPGEINKISFTFWDLNKLLIGFLITIFLVIFAYLIRNNRYELGSNLPELPS